MVTCNLQGTVLEKMYQIAATVGYAVKHNMAYHIPEDKDFPGLKSESMQFGGFVEFHDPCNPLNCEIPYHNNIRLHGKFQSIDYFIHCKKRIARLFEGMKELKDFPI
jgi:hypothetical protein